LRLESLEIKGFGRSRDRTVVQFERGITAFRLEGGDEKATILDALRWLLEGEPEEPRQDSESTSSDGTIDRARVTHTEIIAFFDGVHPFKIGRSFGGSSKGIKYVINGIPFVTRGQQLLSLDRYWQPYCIVNQALIEDLAYRSGSHQLNDFVEDAIGLRPFRVALDVLYRRETMGEQVEDQLADLLAELEEYIESEGLGDVDRRRVSRATEIYLRFTDLMEETLHAAVERFRPTFEDTYSVLVPGGEAVLRWIPTYGEDLAIYVGRRGSKTLTNISAVRQSEQAVVFLRFVLALSASKDARISVLDEIDLLVDEANVDQLADGIKTLSAQSQFILLTRDRRLIGVADKAYAVAQDTNGHLALSTLTMSDKRSILPEVPPGEREQPTLPPALLTEDGLRVYPLKAISSVVDLSPERLLQLVRQQKIRAVKPGKDWFVSIDDVTAYLSSPRRKPGPRSTR
jgi:chromosome segregation ATPase